MGVDVVIWRENRKKSQGKKGRGPAGLKKQKRAQLPPLYGFQDKMTFLPRPILS